MQQNEAGRAANATMRVDNGSTEIGSAKLGGVLAVFLAVPVAVFFWFAAYSPASLAAPIGAGGPTSVWVVYGVGLIAYATLLNGIYLLLTNRQLARRAATLAVAGVAVFAAVPARAATEGATGANIQALSFFIVLVGATLAITYWAARRTRSTKDFYAAGGQLTAWQNGLAMAGDTISAGAFLGLSGLVFANGFDGLLYAAGYAVAYPLIGILFADRMRNIGKFTFADVISFRLSPTPIRAFAATSTLVIAIFSSSRRWSAPDNWYSCCSASITSMRRSPSAC